MEHRTATAGPDDVSESPRRTDVFIYVHDLRSSGVVVNALAFAERIAADHSVALVAGAAEGFFRSSAGERGFELVTLAERSRGPLPRIAAAWRLRRLVRRRRPRVLLSAGNFGHVTPWLATRGLAGIERVYIISNEVVRADGMKSRRRLVWMRLLARDAARLILVGRALGRLGVFGAAAADGRAIEIPNGVDVERARRLAAAPAPHPWLTEDVPVVLGIGRLRPQKNFDLLIAAVGRARATRRLRLVIVGKGKAAEEERLRQLADAAGLGPDFLLAGETDNVFAWLAHASVFALPSRWETSSLALLEALAVGVPVVASRTAGDAAFVLGEGAYGLLVGGADAAELAAAILVQLSDARVLPGSRADDFPRARTVDAHAEVVSALLGD